MSLLAGFMLLMAAAVTERPAIVISAPDSPVRLDKVTILVSSDGPPVVLYSATNNTAEPLEQFTVIAYIFDADGVLKATQLAPGRRTLEAKETKFSTLILDGLPLPPGAAVVVGVNQAQKVDSEAWWRVELRPTAEAAVPKKKP